MRFDLLLRVKSFQPSYAVQLRVSIFIMTGSMVVLVRPRTKVRTEPGPVNVYAISALHLALPTPRLGHKRAG